jgi:hypothetical protein
MDALKFEGFGGQAAGEVDMQQDEISSVFGLRFQRVEDCNNCGYSGVKDMCPEYLDIPNMADFMNSPLSQAESEMIFGSDTYCPTCYNNNWPSKLVTTVRNVQPPMILNLHVGHGLGGYDGTTVLPTTINFLGGVEYRLMAAAYGDGGHFVAVVRDLHDDVLLYADGMANNGQFMKHTSRVFNMKIFRTGYIVNSMFYVRQEHLVVG